MITSTKFWIIVIALASILLAGCVSQPDDVAAAAANIASIHLPDGYRPEYAVNLGGYFLISYNPGDGHSHLYLVQAGAGQAVSQSKLDELLGQAQLGQTDRSTRLTVVEKRAVTIRGQETTLVFSDGINGSGESYRQVTVAFPGKGGQALLVMSEPTGRWEDARVDRLIQSIQ